MKNDHSIGQAFRECRPYLWGAFWFGLFINVLMLAAPLYSLQVLDRVLSSGSLDTLTALTLIVVIALLFMGVLQVLRAMVFSHIGRWLDDRLSSDIVKSAVEIALRNPRIGSQPLRDLGVVRGFVTSQHLANLFDAPWAVIYFSVIYIINIKLGVLVTLGAVALGLLAFAAERLPTKASAAANDEQIKAMQSLEAIIRNAEVVKSMGLLAHAGRKWQEYNQMWLAHSFNSSNLSMVIGQITRISRLGLQIFVMALGAYLAISGEMSPGSIVAISILTGRALAPFDAAAPLYQSLVGVRKALKRLRDISAAADSLVQTTVLPEPRGALSVEKIAYEAQPAKRWILRGVNIEIAAGDAVGIIGPSGSGKTTLARLMVGIMPPSTGAIRIDGATLSQWDKTQLGQAIGYLPQAVELFDGTIAENIARLDPDAEDSAVIEAAQKAHVHETILSFPNGYQTDIGANGSLLSAGQRQRIALARCFYGNPKLIVMDEPNANLDGEGEIAFTKALLKAKELGITTVTIAHRPSVLQCVDKILVLHGGEAKLFGPAPEVMAELANGNAKVQPLHKEQKKA